MVFLYIMENKKLFYTYLFLALTSTQFLLSCEKGKNDTSEVNLPYDLVKISESDTTISFLVSSKSSILHQSSSNTQFNLLLTEVLISVCPILDSNVNFITTILNGFTNTSIDTVLEGSRLRSETRGIVVSPLLQGDSLLFKYQFTIKKGYLIYFTIHLFDTFVNSKKTRLLAIIE